MTKVYPMNLDCYYDNYENRITSQHLYWDYDGEKGNFRAADLCECPEDAILTRDLFTAEDFIWAVKFGMSLGRKGYETIKVTSNTIKGENE